MKVTSMWVTQEPLRAGGHFKATIVSDRFSGLSRVQAQRLVYGVLEQEMRGEIHALSMTTKTIDEAEREA